MIGPHKSDGPACATAYEYRLVTWAPDQTTEQASADLTALGAQGWEAVGITTRATPVMRGGMGATAIPEIVTLLKRSANSC
jgi:hypothetical protein